MSFFTLFPSYFLWHYTTGFVDLKNNSRNLFFFLSHFFSINKLVSSLFEPWQRLGENHFKGEKVYDFFAVIVTNTIMRLVGFFMRAILIVIGMCAYLLAAVCVIGAFVVWPLLPLIAVGSITWGVRNIFI